MGKKPGKGRDNYPGKGVETELNILMIKSSSPV